MDSSLLCGPQPVNVGDKRNHSSLELPWDSEAGEGSPPSLEIPRGMGTVPHSVGSPGTVREQRDTGDKVGWQPLARSKVLDPPGATCLSLLPSCVPHAGQGTRNPPCPGVPPCWGQHSSSEGSVREGILSFRSSHGVSQELPGPGRARGFSARND